MFKYNLWITALLIFTMTSAQAGVIIGGTRIIYQGDKKISLNVKNPDKFLYLIQS